MCQFNEVYSAACGHLAWIEKAPDTFVPETKPDPDEPTKTITVNQVVPSRCINSFAGRPCFITFGGPPYHIDPVIRDPRFLPQRPHVPLREPNQTQYQVPMRILDLCPACEARRHPQEDIGYEFWHNTLLYTLPEFRENVQRLYGQGAVLESVWIIQQWRYDQQIRWFAFQAWRMRRIREIELIQRSLLMANIQAPHQNMPPPPQSKQYDPESNKDAFLASLEASAKDFDQRVQSIIQQRNHALQQSPLRCPGLHLQCRYQAVFPDSLGALCPWGCPPKCRPSFPPRCNRPNIHPCPYGCTYYPQTQPNQPQEPHRFMY